jgi:hypothetical protein
MRWLVCLLAALAQFGKANALRKEAVSSYNALVVEHDGGVGRLILNRPERLNAINLEMQRELPL